MTLIGKLLAFMNLVIGLGLVSWSVSIYVSRPGWFDTIPEGGVDKGNTPISFDMLKQDIASQARAGAIAHTLWGVNLEALKQVEDLRETRLKGYAERRQWHKTGNPKAGGAGFFKPVFVKDSAGKDSSLLDLAALGDPINGSDAKPLRGAETLLANFTDDVNQVVKLSKQIATKLEDFDKLGIKISVEDARLLKMTDIRESVQAELFYLSSFEVNVYETRETVFRRQRQLVGRLTELSGAGQ